MSAMTRMLPLAVVALALACGGGDDPTGPTTTPTHGPGISTNATSTGDSTAPSGPTIVTDKEDYVPTETVGMIGFGWQAGETVTLTLAEDPQVHDIRTYTVTADSVGSFRFEGFIPEAHHAGVRFVLTAVGSSGAQAQTTFTDAIALADSTSNFNGTSGNDRFRLITSTPAANAGDLFVAQITLAKDIPSTEVICPPTGWQHVITTKWAASGTSKINQAVFYHVVPSARAVRPDTFNIRQNSCAGALTTTARGIAGGIIRFTGVDVNHASGPIEAFAGAGTGSGSSTTATAPQITSPLVSQGARVLRFFSAFKASTSNTGITFTPSAGRIWNVGSNNNSSERTAAAFSATQAATGTVAAFNATLSTSAEWLAQTVALRMAPETAPTTTALSASPASPQVAGTSITFTALVKKTSDNSAVTSGTVSFYDGGTCASPGTALASNVALNGSGQAQFNTTTLGTGAHTIWACYSGVAGTFLASGDDLAYTIDPPPAAATTTILSAAPESPRVLGTSITFTAAVTNGAVVNGGTVSFYYNATSCSDLSGSTQIGSAQTVASGSAAVTTDDLPVGSHTIWACYSGVPGTFLASGDDLPYTINAPAAATTTELTAAPASPRVLGTSITFTAAVTNGAVDNGGTVSFYYNATSCSDLSGSTQIGSAQTVASGSAAVTTTTLPVGSHTIWACYSGVSGTFLASGDDLPYTINAPPAPTTTELSASPLSPQVAGTSITFTALVKKTSDNSAVTTGTMNFYDGGTCAAPGTALATNVALNASGQAQATTSGLTVGAHTIWACYSGVSGTFLTSGDDLAYTINPANEAPVVSAGGPYSGAEGSAIALNQASATDGNGDALTYAWTYAPSGAVDAGTSCVFSSATALQPTFTCNDDGTFTVTLEADDGEAKTSANATVTVSNANPVVTIIAPIDYLLVNINSIAGITDFVNASFTDAGKGDGHTCKVNWGDGGGDVTGVVSETPGSGVGTCKLTPGANPYQGDGAGIYTVTVKVADDDYGEGSASVSIVVYDPSAGFVTGGGWINSPAGACKFATCSESSMGKANFGFVAKYQKGANVPTGNTEFQFHAGNLNFHSSNYEWLVVNQGGTTAQYKGTGTINGTGSYKFMLWAQDGLTDKFRIKIYIDNGGGSETIVYDNMSDMPIAGGSIVIHTGGKK